jgi:hypothetical protein
LKKQYSNARLGSNTFQLIAYHDDTLGPAPKSSWGEIW